MIDHNHIRLTTAITFVLLQAPLGCVSPEPDNKPVDYRGTRSAEVDGIPEVGTELVVRTREVVEIMLGAAIEDSEIRETLGAAATRGGTMLDHPELLVQYDAADNVLSIVDLDVELGSGPDPAIVQDLRQRVLAELDERGIVDTVDTANVSFSFDASGKLAAIHLAEFRP